MKRGAEQALRLYDLARAEQDEGRLARAEGLVRRALAAIPRSTHPGGSDVRRLRVRATVTLAALLVARGDWRRARPLYARASRAAERLGPADEDLAVVLCARGVLCKLEGRLDDAEHLYARALGIARRRGGDADTEATLLHNLAGLDHARGHPARAERLARRGLACRAKTVGRAHPSYGADLAGYAAILSSLGRWRAAKPVYARAIRIFERAWGPRHPEIAHALCNLGASCEATGDFRGARRHYARSLAVAAGTLGPSSVDLAVTLHNMSVLASRTGDEREASRLHARALRVARRAVGPRHPRYLELARAGKPRAPAS